MLAVDVWYYNNQAGHERALPKYNSYTYFKSINYSALCER